MIFDHIGRTVKAVLDDILRLEPEAVAAVKRLVLACATQDDKAVLDHAAESLVDLLRRPQASEGIRHFMAKTSPPWAKE
jgi:isohexenylglutaconyl-CoA hydratase